MLNDAAGLESGSPGRLVVISGPSGAGKTSICQALLEQLPETVWSISSTTRPKRAGEVDGKSYEFLSDQAFDARLADGAFLEWAEYVGHRYATPRGPVERWLEQGRCVVMEIDVQGGMQVARSRPDSIRIFVLPPSPDSLRARLEGRNTEAAEQLAGRLKASDGEIAAARDSKCYDYFVVNDLLDATIEEVKTIIRKEMQTP